MANIGTIRTAVRANLSDGSTVWTDAQIDRAVDEVVADFSRLIPQEKVFEAIIDQVVTAEAFTTNHGTAVTLSNKPIDFNSEAVKQSGTTFVRNTDYTMNYADGTITTLSAGSLTDSAGATIDYRKQTIGIDISSLTDLVTPTKVEISVGSVPQKEASFFVWNDVIWLTTSGQRSQSSVSDKTHVRIYYWAQHVAPGASADGSFPLWMDEVLIKGAVAYCLFIKARGLLQEGETEIELGNTALDEILKVGGPIADIDTVMTEFDTIEASIDTELAKGATKLVEAKVEYDVAIDTLIGEVDTILDTALTHLTGASSSAKKALDLIITNTIAADSNTALDKVTTYLEGVSDSAKAALTDIISNVVAADVNTALDSVRSMHELMMNNAGTAGFLQDADDQWTEEVKHILTASGIPNAEEMLDQGAGSTIGTGDKINTVNLGVQVAQQWANYAAVTLAMADRWADRRKDYVAMADRLNLISQTYIQEASARLGGADRLISEGTAWTDVAETFIAEASGRMAQADRLIGEAVQWKEVAATMNDFATNRNVNAQMQIQTANGYVSMALGYIEEAEAYVENGRILIDKAGIRLGAGNLNLGEGQGRVVIGQEYVNLADRYRADALERHADYWTILRSRVQQARQRSMVSPNQYESGGSSERLASLPS